MGPSSTTVTLEQRGPRFAAVVVERSPWVPRPARRRVAVDAQEVERHLAQLRRCRVPAWPESPPVCDGAYVELTVHGAGSTLTLGWWTLAPEGAEGFARFARWLVGFSSS
ncbi:hypothetical protein [Acidovorax lacteus]